MESSKNFSSFLLGVIAGAGAMFFSDPVRGKTRRALVRDQIVSAKNDLIYRSDKFSRDLTNRFQGILHSVRHPKSKDVDDQTLEQRVRSEFGRVLTHAKAVHTTVIDGVVTLSGPIFASEVDYLIKCVQKVPGVKDVINHLDARTSAQGVPSLQGAGPKYLQNRR